MPCRGLGLGNTGLHPSAPCRQRLSTNSVTRAAEEEKEPPEERRAKEEEGKPRAGRPQPHPGPRGPVRLPRDTGQLSYPDVLLLANRKV